MMKMKPGKDPRPARKMWELRQQAERPDILDLYIYGDVEAESFVDDGWWGYFEESETSAAYFRDALAARPNVSQINVYINSYGGSVFEGNAIYNQLRRHPAHKTVYIDAFACSIASVIAMAGDEVIMPRNALMMIHNMSMAVFGSAVELRKAADDLDIINTAGRAAYMERAGDRLTEERLIEMMDGETWLSAQECIDFGFADRFADQDADMSQAAEVLQKAGMTLEQRIQFNKGLAAQLRALTEVPAAPEEPPAQDSPVQKGSVPEPGASESLSVMQMLIRMGKPQ